MSEEFITFVTLLNNRLGQDDNNKFDVFSVDNSLAVCLLYNMMKSYQTATKSKKIKLPHKIKENKNSLKCYFEDIDDEKVSNIIDNKKMKNINLSDNNVLDITKTKEKANLTIGGGNK